MLEYSVRSNPDWVSLEAVSDDKVWSWLEMVVKGGISQSSAVYRPPTRSIR
jgi:hypothetical protein